MKGTCGVEIEFLIFICITVSSRGARQEEGISGLGAAETPA